MTKRTKAGMPVLGKKQPTVPAATKSFEQAKPEWHPLHVAMLRFFPTYATEKAFPNEVKRMVTALTGPDDFSVSEIAAYVVRIALGGVGLVIDAADGEIEIEAQVVGDEWATIFNDFVSFAPGLINSQQSSRRRYQARIREAARWQHDLALELMRSLKA